RVDRRAALPDLPHARRAAPGPRPSNASDQSCTQTARSPARAIAPTTRDGHALRSQRQRQRTPMCSPARLRVPRSRHSCVNLFFTTTLLEPRLDKRIDAAEHDPLDIGNLEFGTMVVHHGVRLEDIRTDLAPEGDFLFGGVKHRLGGVLP